MFHISLLAILSVYHHSFVGAGYQKPRLRLPELVTAGQCDTESKSQRPEVELQPRGDTVTKSTCGYATGDPKQPRSADVGFACRVDTKNALWGFCPESVIQASDCGLAGACLDLHACDSVCGITDDSSITTFSCTKKGQDYCSTALLTAGPDQTYSYLACAPAAKTDHLLASTTAESSTQTPSAAPSTRAKPSVLSPSSTMSSTTSSVSASPTPSATTTSVLGKPPTNTIAPNAPAASTNSTGAIVGGTIGGVALLCFIAFAIFVLRRLKSLRATGSPASPSLWRSDNKFAKGEPSRDHQPEWTNQQPDLANPMELSSERHASEMSGGRQHEAHELYSRHP